MPIADTKTFLDYNDIELKRSDINKFQPARVVKTDDKTQLTCEISKMVSFTTKLRTKMLNSI
ncbi:MAG: hypothetical protein OEL56_07170 [Nitrosopumilus sp.]|nr:hypothetical protein [Nitrosopumilus sp.]MDH3490214.1 hypothetical protein [Nitrosopumilus sp.]MDH3516953.1 hypothetical protein [Nitrosopumilus sp.]MDH3565328.1 hypothetical protein [Nitrosopumilus sp.]MDH5417012.1 hypothetical protein [Nitrosopumilus sp.]